MSTINKTRKIVHNFYVRFGTIYLLEGIILYWLNRFFFVTIIHWHGFMYDIIVLKHATSSFFFVLNKLKLYLNKIHVIHSIKLIAG